MKRLLPVILGIAGLLALNFALAQSPNDPGDAAFDSDCDAEVCALFEPNDTRFSEQYGPQIVQAPAAWDIGTGLDTTIIATVDTGIACDHPDLAGKCVAGWNALTGTPISPTSNSDDHGHGTHVTSIEAGVTNNGVGVAGICWGCLYMPVKVLDSGGLGVWEDAAEGILFAADNGADIINLSLGGGTADPNVESAVNYAYGLGVLVVSACGNSGNSTNCLYPAHFANSMAVSCSDSDDNICSFSSAGVDHEVDVAAPGQSVLAAVPTGACSLCDPSGYRLLSGTSMSTPHVSGLAGLIRSHRPGLTVDQEWGLLEQSADDRGNAGYDRLYGFGRINAFRALTETPPAGRLAKPPGVTPTPVPPPPTNDNFADATEIFLGTRSSNNVGTTNEANEPLPCNTRSTVWFFFTPSISQLIEMNTNGSNYDTVLAVYTGTSLPALALVKCDDDSGDGLNSLLTFDAVAGTTYRVQLGGFGGGTGSFLLTVRDAGATPTSPTPTTTPTVTPTPSPSSSPSPSPSPSPTPSPTPCPRMNPQLKCVGRGH